LDENVDAPVDMFFLAMGEIGIRMLENFLSEGFSERPRGVDPTCEQRFHNYLSSFEPQLLGSQHTPVQRGHNNQANLMKILLLPYRLHLLDINFLPINKLRTELEAKVLG
jgi:hypothetical protein